MATKPKQELIESYRVHESDTGSPEVQIALLTGWSSRAIADSRARSLRQCRSQPFSFHRHPAVKHECVRV